MQSACRLGCVRDQRISVGRTHHERTTSVRLRTRFGSPSHRGGRPTGCRGGIAGRSRAARDDLLNPGSRRASAVRSARRRASACAISGDQVLVHEAYRAHQSFDHELSSFPPQLAAARAALQNADAALVGGVQDQRMGEITPDDSALFQPAPSAPKPAPPSPRHPGSAPTQPLAAGVRRSPGCRRRRLQLAPSRCHPREP